MLDVSYQHWLPAMNLPSLLLPDLAKKSAISTPLRLILATTAAFWLGTAPAQVPAPNNTRAVSELRFRQFFRNPVGPTGLEISDTLRQSDGETIRLTGYMVQHEIPTPGRFMLAPRPVQMSEHADGDADDLPASTVTVYLDASQSDWAVPHVRGLVSVNGQLQVKRQEAADGRVTWVHLQLDESAARNMNAFELTGYLHSLQHRH
jgi:hypothetical protein